MKTAEKRTLNIQAEWVSHVDWSPFSTRLLDLENSLGKEVRDSLHKTRIFEYPWVYSNLQPFSHTDVVLDAGAANTALQFLLSKEVKEVYSLDIEQSYVEWVAKTCEERHFDNLFPEHGDILCAPYPDEYFDKVICISTLEHLPKTQVGLAIDELVRLVKPGGKMALTMDISHTPTDQQMTMLDFEELVGQWFTIPELNEGTMVFDIEPQLIMFSVICILIEKENQ